MSQNSKFCLFDQIRPYGQIAFWSRTASFVCFIKYVHKGRLIFDPVPRAYLGHVPQFCWFDHLPWGVPGALKQPFVRVTGADLLRPRRRSRSVTWRRDPAGSSQWDRRRYVHKEIWRGFPRVIGGSVVLEGVDRKGIVEETQTLEVEILIEIWLSFNFES